jgi:hypothetical protein
MIDRLFDYPALYVSVVFGLLFALIASTLIVALKPLMRARATRDGEVNGLVEITLNGFSALYGILLGLLAVGAYENLNNMGDVVSKEASAISVLYRDFRGYPEAVRPKLEQELRAYARHVVEKSFVQQANRQRPTGESDLIDAVFDTLIAFEPRNKAQEILHAETIAQFNTLMEARRTRLTNLSAGIPAILWWIVALGAVINLLLIGLLDFPLAPHLAFGCLLAFFIGAMIFVIASMDNPFSGADRVKPDAIQLVIEGPAMQR